VPLGDLGGLFIGIGVVLVLTDAASGTSGISGMAIRGTLPTPETRLSSAAKLVGSLFVAIGSALLLAASHGLTVFAVAIVVGTSALLMYVVMTFRLHAHIEPSRL